MLVALLLAAATSHPVGPLQSAFAAAHRDYLAQLNDKFAGTTTDPASVGKAFKYVGPVNDGDSYDGLPGDAYYTYKDGKLTLTFSLSEEHAPADFEGPKYMVGIVGGKRSAVRSYVGTNAFGVRARVEVDRLDKDGLAMLDRPEGEENPYRSTYSLKIALPGPAARKAAVDAGLIVEGTIESLADGKLSICKSNASEPEIDAPYEIYGSECWIGAKVTRIAFIRKSTGEVLKEWVK